MPSIKRVQTKSDELNRIQDSYLPFLNSLLKHPLLDGRLVETYADAQGTEIPILLTAAFRNIPHKLGRAYRGAILTGRDQNATIWEDATADGPTGNPDRTKFIRLRAAGTNVNIKLWIF